MKLKLKYFSKPHMLLLNHCFNMITMAITQNCFFP